MSRPGHDSLPSVLEEHGVDRCVSRAEYEQAGAAQQRLVAGAVLAFFAMHAGAAAARRRRRSARRTAVA